MKIDELVGYKEKPEYNLFKSPPEEVADTSPNAQLRTIAAKLNELGYQQYNIGSGYYAQAYARPQDNYVIKIFREDRGYTTFLNYVTKNANNPYVPKLKGKIIRLPNKYSIVRLEKLKRIDIDLFKKIDYATFNEHDKPLIAELEAQYPGLIEFIRSLINIANTNNIHYDLHRSNMMMRGDTPVIIDPFA